MKTLNLICFALILLCTSITTLADGASSALRGKTLAIYKKANPNDCYVLLKPQHYFPNDIESSDHPVCWAVLENMNKFCNKPPQYSKRKLHPSTTNLQEPNWHSMDPGKNLDIIKEIISTGDPIGSPDRRASIARYFPKAEKQIKRGRLKLSYANINTDDLGQKTIYRLENLFENDPQPGANQANYSISEPNEKKRSDSFRESSVKTAFGDPFIFQKHLFLIGYSELRHPGSLDSFDNFFTIVKISKELEKPVNAETACTLQHINDRRKGE